MQKLRNEELGRLTEEEFHKSKKSPIIIVLDNIRSMHNVGAAFRTADAFRIEKIILAGITATPPHREIHKVALGASETVEWEYQKDVKEVLVNLKDLGFQIVAIEQADESIELQDFDPAENKMALVFGNEVYGVSDPVIDEADYVVEIPQYGTKHSLNVSVSIGVVLWEVIKKIGMPS
jgi:tRNA G18 (ribose-2'-O)-methylase SpoU